MARDAIGSKGIDFEDDKKALPNWLNYEADKAGINVSRVLQEALIKTLNLSRPS